MKKLLLSLLIISSIAMAVSCTAPEDKEDTEQESSSLSIAFVK